MTDGWVTRNVTKPAPDACIARLMLLLENNDNCVELPPSPRLYTPQLYVWVHDPTAFTVENDIIILICRARTGSAKLNGYNDKAPDVAVLMAVLAVPVLSIGYGS